MDSLNRFMIPGMCFRYLSVVLLVSASGCGGEKADPVKEYETFMKSEFDVLQKSNPEMKLESKFLLDVKKSESLVSPLIGTCSVKALWLMEFDGSKDTYSGLLNTIEIELVHGFQEGKWVFTEGTATVIGIKVVMAEGKENTMEERMMQKAFDKHVGRVIKLTSLSALPESFKSK